MLINKYAKCDKHVCKNTLITVISCVLLKICYKTEEQFFNKFITTQCDRKGFVTLHHFSLEKVVIGKAALF